MSPSGWICRVKYLLDSCFLPYSLETGSLAEHEARCLDRLAGQ